jgi:hypothetical protein
VAKPYYEDDIEGDERLKTSGLSRAVTIDRRGDGNVKSRFGKDLEREAEEVVGWRLGTRTRSAVLTLNEIGRGSQNNRMTEAATSPTWPISTSFTVVLVTSNSSSDPSVSSSPALGCTCI